MEHVGTQEALGKGRPEPLVLWHGVGSRGSTDDGGEGNESTGGKPSTRGGPEREGEAPYTGPGSLPANLVRVNAAARRSCKTQFTALLHHVDEGALSRALHRQMIAGFVEPRVGRVHLAGRDVTDLPPWSAMLVWCSRATPLFRI
jgi:hypothetical protein